MNLLPQPRHATASGGTVPDARAHVRVHRERTLGPQSYRLVIGADAIEIVAGDEAGESYARATLAQIAQAHEASGGRPGVLPEMTVEDSPDLAVRGVMLDVSRDKVPTLETLKVLVDRLAAWKVNHLQLYMEHTFAYAGHDAVWGAADPFTGDEIEELDSFCRERHVELSANQNCLGHFERWLQHDPYRELAIAPDGWVDARGRRRPPTTLDPAKPASLELVRSLLGELLPRFTSRRVNVGLDEPWELAPERHDEYVDYIAALRAAPELAGHEMLLWGDIVASDPGMEGRLPHAVTVCEWGYEANHPFDARASVLSGAGRPFWLCPGTSSWNTLVGRATNMRENCLNAATAAVAHGAQGWLVTDWGDNGHLQYLPVSEPAFAFAAAVSWCRDANADLDLAAALDVHGFRDAASRLGGALLALGDAHRGVEPQVPNMSVLCLPLYAPAVRMGEGWTQGITDADLTRVAEQIGSAGEDVASSQSSRADARLVRDEVANSVALLSLLLRDARARLAAGGRLDDVASSTRASLASDLVPIIERHRDLWRARNREGGLVDSVARLERLQRAYTGA